MYTTYKAGILNYWIAIMETNDRHKYHYLDLDQLSLTSDMRFHNERLLITATWDQYIYTNISHEHVC